MPIRPDTDYSPYIYWAYGIASVALVATLVWTVLRITAANRKLRETEAEEMEDHK